MSDDHHGGRGDGGSWAATPSWDGDPTRFRTYQQEVWLWYDTLSDAPKYSCGARLVRGLTGLARKTGRNLNRAQLRGTPGTPAVPAGGGDAGAIDASARAGEELVQSVCCTWF